MGLVSGDDEMWNLCFNSGWGRERNNSGVVVHWPNLPRPWMVRLVNLVRFSQEMGSFWRNWMDAR
ncbi:unnamed protein product [Prunus armeniaca]|uniref:Uncharacterized protein n=1 Tax=Prunus armeniaca TaxID=36596 RepID=A0A6J5Y1P5_PRUAR|nr:unnamed protein product [Prunus armeniaca]